MPSWTDNELEGWRQSLAAVQAGEPAGLSFDDALALIGELQELRSRLSAGQPPLSRQGWVPSDEALDLCRSVFFESLPPLALEGLTSWLAGEIKAGRESEHRDVYSDALYDLSQLLEEVRFEAAVADAYILDLKDELFSEPDPADLSRTVGIPAEVLALLSPYFAQNWSPMKLFTDPGARLPGERVLGGWHAGQLLDAALIRSMAALDRLAILLWSAAGRQFERDKAGDLRLPAFRQGYLDQMLADYGQQASWPALRALVEHDFMKFVKPYRDGFIHRRRFPMELHGEHLTVTNLAAGSTRTKGLDASDHLAMVLGFYTEILKPAIVTTSDLLTARQ